MTDCDEVYAYTINRWDCPYCGEVNESDAELDEFEFCDDCGLKVRVL